MNSRKCPAFVKPAVIALMCILLIIAASLTGCKLSSIATQKSATPTTTPPPAETEGSADLNKDVQKDENNQPAPPTVVFHNVLTGLETTSELAGLRPVAVCIGNTPYSLPQYGLTDAQIMIEVPLEDGTTRLMILTTDYRYVTTIGAVESTRSYLLELGQSFGAIQSFNGSDGTVSDEVLATYDTLDFASQNLAGVYYYDATRFAESDLMTNGILLDTGIRRTEINPKPDTALKCPYAFVEEGSTVNPADGSGKTATLHFSDDLNVVYTYDAATGKYLRSQYGAAQLDGNTQNQVSFDNLFFLQTSYEVYRSETETSLDLVLEDGGSGYYLTRGTYQSFTWTCAQDGTLSFLDATGNTLLINRGTSYIGMLPAGNPDNLSIR